MKKLTLIALILALCQLLPCALGEDTGRDPGLHRSTNDLAYRTYDYLAEKFDLHVDTNWNDCDHRYAPGHGKPLNVFMVTHPDCWVGIARQGMFKVADKGLVDSITRYLNTWIQNIKDASGGTILFVADPDQADILLVVKQTFRAHGTYQGGGQTVTGYATRIDFYAYCLSDPSLEISVSKSNVPGGRVSVNGGGNFWMNPPEFRNTEQLQELVNGIMGWYGYQASVGSAGNGVYRARQALIDRGYLQADWGAECDGDMEAAIRLLQKDYGLEETGVIDRATLAALYYDKASVAYMLASYPVPAAEETEENVK